MRRVAYSMGSAGLVGVVVLLSCGGNEFSAGATSTGASGGEGDASAGADTTTAGRGGSSSGGSNGSEGGQIGDAGEPGAMAGSVSGGTTGHGGKGDGGSGGAAGSSFGIAQGRITAGPTFACAIRSEGTLACWGPTLPKTPAGTFDSVTAGGQGEVNACALSGTKVTCWGSNSNGQSGERTTAYKAVAAGGVFSCGIRSSDSKVECWGIGFAANYMFEGTAVALDAGVPVACALFTDGHIDCRGGSGTNWNTPPGAFSAVSTGEHHACAIRDDSSIVCWGGSNLAGEETAPSGSFIAVSAGYLHSCAIRSDKTVACWGDNTHGQASPPSGQFAAVAAGIYDFYTCGIRTDGSIACWGRPDSGLVLPPSGSFLPP